MNIYKLFFRVQWQLRTMCGPRTLPCQSGPDFSRAESVIPSHADWLGYIWMTVLNLCALGSCLCALPRDCATFKSRPGVHICIPIRTWGKNILVIVMQSLFLFISYLFLIWMKAQDYCKSTQRWFQITLVETYPCNNYKGNQTSILLYKTLKVEWMQQLNCFTDINKTQTPTCTSGKTKWGHFDSP